MAKITLDNISKNYGSVQVIKNINLEIADGEFTVFVGPSGCGKSTLLRMIAGLEDVSDGTLAIDGRRVNDLPPKERGVAMVFQNYAIFPHMSVRENIAFGLTISGASKEEKQEKVARAAEMLALEPLLDRRPSQLSGGQRQRVAIGRAIVRHPKVFLFDEPLSNLDAALRMDMRMEIAQLHARLGATMIYVTHDQVEAMTLADKIVVLKDGQIQQIGAPMDLWHNPANEFVAGFIGAPAMNFMLVDIVDLDGEQAQIRHDIFGTISVPLRGRRFERGHSAKLGIRPHYLTPVAAADRGTVGSLKGQVGLVERLGNETVLAVTLGNGTSLIASLADDMVFNRGDDVALSFDPARCHLFPV